MGPAGTFASSFIALATALRQVAHSAMTMKPPAISDGDHLAGGQHDAASSAGGRAPSDWNALEMPCHRCEPTTTMLST